MQRMPQCGGRGYSRLQLLLHLCELLLGHGSFSLSQLLQLLSGCIKVGSGRGRGDLDRHKQTNK